MKFGEVTRVWSDGAHNAFTDLCRWGDHLWLCFRHAQNHTHVVPGSIYVLQSRDGVAWEKTTEMAEEGTDLRDPKFTVMDDRLMVYGQRRQHESQGGVMWRPAAYWTADGETWMWQELNPPVEYRIWRPFRINYGFYAGAHTKLVKNGADHSWVDLAFSRDGLAWHRVARIVSHLIPNETAIDIAPDGKMTALVRREGGIRTPLVCTADPPYTRWHCRESDRVIQGPLMRRMGERLLVVGRCYEHDEPRTGMFWLEGATLRHIATLPSGGDTSYAAMVETGENSALLSYYSGHEFETGGAPGADGVQETAIYLARLEW